MSQVSKLAPKQEAYAHARTAGKRPSDAYRASRDTSRMATSTINANAKRLERKPAVKARIEQLRRESGVADKDPISTRARTREGRPDRKGGGQGEHTHGGAVAEMGRDGASGRFLPGNRFWEARASSGPAPRFANGEMLWAACVKYFEWVEDNPLYEAQMVTFRGAASAFPIAKMRPMTIRGLCIFLGISHRTWNEWKKDREDLLETIERVDSVIYTWKFDGAAAGLLNANLIARELGLADKQEHGGKDGGPIQVQELVPQHM